MNFLSHNFSLLNLTAFFCLSRISNFGKHIICAFVIYWFIDWATLHSLNQAETFL